MPPRSIIQPAGGVRGRRSDRFLFHWEAEDGLDPLGRLVARTGQIGSFSRGGVVGAAMAADSLGVRRQVGAQEPRFVTLGGVVTLLLEGQRESLIAYSSQVDNAAWSKTSAGAGSNPVVTANQGSAPDGSSGADKVVFAAPASGDQSFLGSQSFTTAAATYAGSWWVKAFAAADVGKTLLFRHVGGSTYTPVTLTAEWQRLSSIEVSTSGSRTQDLGLRPSHGGSSGTVTALVWHGQCELGAHASSEIPTGAAAVIRSGDFASFALNPVPTAMAFFLDVIDAGNAAHAAATATTRAMKLTNAADSGASVGFSFPNGKASFVHYNGTATVSSTQTATKPNTLDRLRLFGYLGADGSVRCYESRNGGPEVDAGVSGANVLASAWVSGAVLNLGANSGASAGAWPFLGFVSARIAAGAPSFAYLMAA